MKNKLIILVGIPGSGKSTWAKEYLKNNSNTIRINRDDLRVMLKDKGFVDKNIESLISNIQANIIQESFLNKIDVIIDATNCKLKYIKGWVDNFSHTFDIKIKLFEIDKGEAYSRNAKRYQLGLQPLVPINVIDNMFENLQELKEKFNFKDYIL